MIEQGYKEEDIFFTPNKSPDFTCNDGSRYEAKKLYGRNILMYATQIESLENAIIVVVDTNKERVIRTFKFSDREKQKGIGIKTIDVKKVTLKIESDTHKELIKMLSKRQIERGGKRVTMEKLLKELIENAKNEER